MKNRTDSKATTVNRLEKGHILEASPVKRLLGELVVTEEVDCPETVFIVVACAAAWVELEDAAPIFQVLDERACGMVWLPVDP